MFNYDFKFNLKCGRFNFQKSEAGISVLENCNYESWKYKLSSKRFKI